MTHGCDTIRVRQLSLRLLALAQVDDKRDGLVLGSLKVATPTSTGTRLPSLRKNSSSLGFQVPVATSSGETRSSSPAHSGGVRPVQRMRPEMTSSRYSPPSGERRRWPPRSDRRVRR